MNDGPADHLPVLHAQFVGRAKDAEFTVDGAIRQAADLPMLDVGRQNIAADRVRPSAREELPQRDEPCFGFAQGPLARCFIVRLEVG